MVQRESSSIVIARAMERLRQEQEIFDQLKRHTERWFLLQLVMGYSSVILLTAALIISSMILFNNQSFPTFVTIAAGGALFTDVLGLVIMVWKVVLNPTSLPPRLHPTLDIPASSEEAEGNATAQSTTVESPMQ